MHLSPCEAEKAAVHRGADLRDLNSYGSACSKLAYRLLSSFFFKKKSVHAVVVKLRVRLTLVGILDVAKSKQARPHQGQFSREDREGCDQVNDFLPLGCIHGQDVVETDDLEVVALVLTLTLTRFDDCWLF